VTRLFQSPTPVPWRYSMVKQLTSTWRASGR